MCFLFHLIIIESFFLCGNFENIIDVDDILSIDFMPGTFLMLENSELQNKNQTVVLDSTKLDGGFNTAIESMGFHRSKMNEYLCRNYVAQQIIDDISFTRIKRMGANPSGFKPAIMTNTKDKLLEDEGSSNYKNWLFKSTTLDDIYRHYNNINNHTISTNKEDKDDEIYDDYNNHLANGHLNHPKIGDEPHHSGNGGFYYPGTGAGRYPYGGNNYGYDEASDHGGVTGYENSGHSTGYGGTGTHLLHDLEHIVHDHPKFEIFHKGSDKHAELAHLFEIALTALAYLSFGLFVLHVIMCISMAHTNSTTTTTAASLLAMSLTSSATGTGSEYYTGTGTGSFTSPTDSDFERDKDPVKFRLKRNIVSNYDNQLLNQLAKKVLFSIEAAMVAPSDDGNCLRKALCENNKFSRTINDNNRIWLPIWSLGLSWASGRILDNSGITATTLNSLKASVFGLGNINCDIIYQNCDLLREKQKMDSAKT